MRIAVRAFLLATFCSPGVQGGASVETDSIPVPVPGPPGPPGLPGPSSPLPPPASQCSTECEGAQFLVCNKEGNACSCGSVFGQEKTCSYDSCCKPVGVCCSSITATAYRCMRNQEPICTRNYNTVITNYNNCVAGCGSISECRQVCLTLLKQGEKFEFSELGECCPQGTFDDQGDRRSLNEVADLTLSQNELLDHESADACKEEEFDIYLFIDNTHFSAIASPSEQAQTAGCPFLLVSSDFGPDRNASKKAWVWSSTEVGESFFPSEKQLLIGTFSGDKLLDAFENASPAKPGSYDFLTNNCAEFMINLARELDIEIDSNIVTFATRRLLADKRNGLIEKIRTSASYFSFFGERNLHGEEMPEHELVGLLVEKRANDQDAD